jgi:hypothetical protein
MAPERIGFDRLIRLPWLDQTALLAGELRDGDALHGALLQHLALDLSGKDARRKTANVLTRIWWRTQAQHAPLRDEALARFPACHPDDRLILHWGMVLLAYPLFGQVASTVGRLLRLQGSFRLAQLSQRIAAEWGHRSTLDTAVPRSVYSLLDWQALVGTEQPGVYQAGQPISATDPATLRWLLEAAMTAYGNDRPLSDLLRAVELFPFDVAVGASQVTQSPRLQVYQQGQEMTMVHALGGDRALSP